MPPQTDRFQRCTMAVGEFSSAEFLDYRGTSTSAGSCNHLVHVRDEVGYLGSAWATLSCGMQGKRLPNPLFRCIIGIAKKCALYAEHYQSEHIFFQSMAVPLYLSKRA